MGVNPRLDGTFRAKCLNCPAMLDFGLFCNYCHEELGEDSKAYLMAYRGLPVTYTNKVLREAHAMGVADKLGDTCICNPMGFNHEKDCPLHGD